MNIEIGDLWIGDEYLIAVFERDPRLILADRSGHSGCILRAYDYEPAVCILSVFLYPELLIFRLQDFHLVYWKAEMQPRLKIMVLQEVVASYFLIAEVPFHIPLVNPTANSRSPDRWTTLPMVILRSISVSPSAQLFLPPSQSWPSLSFPYCVVTGLPKTAPELSSEQDSCGPSFEAQWYSVPKDGNPVPISNKALVLDYEQRDLLVEFCGISIIGSRTVVFPFHSFDFKKLCSKELDVGDYTPDPSMTMFATIIRGFDPVYGRLIIESGSGVGWGEGEALDVLQF
ncbi:hypothetical protein SISNIDRAFT_174541 [Sistotremastrum niveocremeum HHB9708]|uniref:Uncharacterized protein n=1 Tax=Sistotremastrum niveocremeum HHB9708 TaxID=1314777 RepID=A0A164RMR9_9AGAM|nr:hypothetical protein SISNIDRAFT_174541 [Sistotremastrum niveocremeum HHB9708]